MGKEWKEEESGRKKNVHNTVISVFDLLISVGILYGYTCYVSVHIRVCESSIRAFKRGCTARIICVFDVRKCVRMYP